MICSSVNRFFIAVPLWNGLYTVTVLNAGSRSNALLDDPSVSRTLDEWASQVGASARTLARLFVRETGLTYAQWRTRCRLLVAQAQLAEGASVTAVARAVGYASDSAFIAMYRRVYGKSPGRRNRSRRQD
ncbi:helix-turn-helix domain-containing protein [Burkholderia cepacia]|nr:AraC family transcriptional regulator [Burkholderia cepacia]